LWVVATEEGVWNVKFYTFTNAAEAWKFFRHFYAVSRILFDNYCNELKIAGDNMMSFRTIRKEFWRRGSSLR